MLSKATSPFCPFVTGCVLRSAIIQNVKEDKSDKSDKSSALPSDVRRKLQNQGPPGLENDRILGSPGFYQYLVLKWASYEACRKTSMNWGEDNRGDETGNCEARTIPTGDHSV